MQTIVERIEELHWARITEEMNKTGYALLPDVMSAEECAALVEQYDNPELYRKTIVMERYRFGVGEYKYFRYPLPAILQTIRETVYPKLSPIANNWMELLGIERRFPKTFAELQHLCHTNHQTKPTVLILKYSKGGYNTLHQDLYGEVFFPLQLVLFLDEVNIAYKGGEFVLVEQRPRAQSKAIVLQPRRGTMLLFTTNFRPVRGSKGYYRVTMKHGVSEVQEGRRHTAGVIFHDAL